MASPAEVDAMRRALVLAAEPDLPPGPNPRVGCVILEASGRVVAEGAHQGAGTPHAEVVALAAAGALARGATAVVTLEPCRHTGRTGPCTQALIEAGIRRVVHAANDPNPVAAGGAAELRAAGVEVEGAVLAAEAESLNPEWTFAVRHGRPFVTWKTAATLDGRVAAADLSSRWITSLPARGQVHDLRAAVDAVLVGTGTVLADDPALTARESDGALRDRQPLRVVMGRSVVPASAKVYDGDAVSKFIRGSDPAAALSELYDMGVRHVLLEAGPRLAASFVRNHLVERVVWFVAPALLGAGPHVVDDLGVATVEGARRLRILNIAMVGPDVRIDAEFVWED